jgi:predicted nucleotidyltransferase
MSSNTMLEVRRLEGEQLIERITQLLMSDERVVAAWVFGSLADGTADSLSDIDLWIVVADEHIEEIGSGRREYVGILGEPLLIQEAPQNAPTGGAYLLVLYKGEAGPQHVDWYWQPQSKATLPSTIQILFDRGGLPAAPQPIPLTQEERAKTLSNQVAFFWAMCNIAAKKIARRQAWGALSMLSMLSHTIEEIEWLVGLRDERPGHKDSRTELPPVQAADQMAMLRQITGDMEKLAPHIEAHGGSIPTEAIPQIYHFFDLAQRIALEEGK